MSDHVCRHFGRWKEREIVVMGWNAQTNVYLICDINRLVAEDQDELRALVRSDVAQGQKFLIYFLDTMSHRRGMRWFVHLLKMAPSGEGVHTVSADEITDYVNVDRRRAFMESEKIRHFAKWRNTDVVVLGWQKKTGFVLICELDGLSLGDETDLCQIVQSELAQKEDSLSHFLEKHRHSRGDRWWAYIMLKMHYNSGVRTVDIRDLTFLNVEQATAIYERMGIEPSQSESSQVDDSIRVLQIGRSRITRMEEKSPIVRTPLLRSIGIEGGCRK